MSYLCQTVNDVVLVADPVEDMREGVSVVRHIGKLDAVIGQHRVDRIGDRLDRVAQELGGKHLAGSFVQLDQGELAGPVDRDEQSQLALCRLHLGDVDVEVTDQIGLELALGLFVAGYLRQSTGPVPLQAAVKR